jgi:biofilm PGA synthesis N-glycosyltransferase PgaC
MGKATMTYAVVTPVRNEQDTLPRLAESLRAQTQRPTAWVIVDTGSDDQTAQVAADLTTACEWIRLISSAQPFARGGAIVRAFQAGAAVVPQSVEVIVKADADISLGPEYFADLLCHFVRDARLGIASGTCLERQGGEWRPRQITGDHVWGNCRAYRRPCLRDVAPLEQDMGWDGIDVFKAHARGWRTVAFADPVFQHHRAEGDRDGPWSAWKLRGRAAHYMGYRPSFVAIRALHHARRDLRAVAMVVGWAGAAARRRPRCSDSTARALLRQQQRLRELPARAREASGRRNAPTPSV